MRTHLVVLSSLSNEKRLRGNVFGTDRVHMTPATGIAWCPKQEIKDRSTSDFTILNDYSADYCCRRSPLARKSCSLVSGDGARQEKMPAHLPGLGDLDNGTNFL